MENECLHRTDAAAAGSSRRQLAGECAAPAAAARSVAGAPSRSLDRECHLRGLFRWSDQRGESGGAGDRALDLGEALLDHPPLTLGQVGAPGVESLVTRVLLRP